MKDVYWGHKNGDWFTEDPSHSGSCPAEFLVGDKCLTQKGAGFYKPECGREFNLTGFQVIALPKVHEFNEFEFIPHNSYFYLLIKADSADDSVKADVTTLRNLEAPYLNIAESDSFEPVLRGYEKFRRYPGVLTSLQYPPDFRFSRINDIALGFNFGTRDKTNTNYNPDSQYIAISSDLKDDDAVQLIWRYAGGLVACDSMGYSGCKKLSGAQAAEIATAAGMDPDKTHVFDVKSWVDNGLLKNSCVATGPMGERLPTQGFCSGNDLVVLLKNVTADQKTTLELPFKIINSTRDKVQEYTHDPISLRPMSFLTDNCAITNSAGTKFISCARPLSEISSSRADNKFKITKNVLFVRPQKGGDYAFTYDLPRVKWLYTPNTSEQFYISNFATLHAGQMYAALQDDTLIEYFLSESEASKHCRVLLQPDPADANRVDEYGKISCYTPGMVPLTDSYEPAFSTQVAADWFGRTNFLLANEKDFAMILRHRLGGDEPFEIAAGTSKTLKIYDKVKSRDGVSDFIIAYRKDPAQVGGDELRELDCANDVSGITCACYETYTPEGCPLKPMRESITFSADEVNGVFKDRLDKMCAAYGCTKGWQKISANTSLQNESYTDAADITGVFEAVKSTAKSHAADTYRSTDNVKIQRVNLFATTATRLLPQPLGIRKAPGSSDGVQELIALAAKLTFNDQKMLPTSNTLDINASDVKLIAPMNNRSNPDDWPILIQQSCVGAPGVCFSIENDGVPGFSGRAKVDLISDYNVPITLSGTDYNTFKYTYSLTNHELQNVTYIRDNINCLKGAIGCNNFSILRHIKPAQ